MKIILKLMVSIAAVMAVATMVHAAKPPPGEDTAPPNCPTIQCFSSSQCTVLCGGVCHLDQPGQPGHCSPF